MWSNFFTKLFFFLNPALLQEFTEKIKSWLPWNFPCRIWELHTSKRFYKYSWRQKKNVKENSMWIFSKYVKILCSFLYKDLYFISNYFKNLHESLAGNSLVASMTWENHVSSYKMKVIIKWWVSEFILLS